MKIRSEGVCLKSLVTMETFPENEHKIWETHTVRLNGATVVQTHVFGAAVNCYSGMRSSPEKLQEYVEERVEELTEYIQHDLRMGRPQLVRSYAEEIIKLMDGLEHESKRLDGQVNRE